MRAIHEIEVELGKGEVIYLAVMDNHTVCLVAATDPSLTLRATRVTLTEEALRELISKLRETLHYLMGPAQSP